VEGARWRPYPPSRLGGSAAAQQHDPGPCCSSHDPFPPSGECCPSALLPLRCRSQGNRLSAPLADLSCFACSCFGRLLLLPAVALETPLAIGVEVAPIGDQIRAAFQRSFDISPMPAPANVTLAPFLPPRTPYDSIPGIVRRILRCGRKNKKFLTGERFK
jgi:hypothetical protein